MESTMEEAQVQQVLRSGLTLSALGIVLMVGCVWILYTYTVDHLLWLATPTPLIVKSSGVTALYLGVLGLLAVLVYGLAFLVVGLRGRRPQWIKRIERLGLILTFAGLAGMIIGRPIGNAYWAERLAAAGYTECAGRGFTLTGQLFREVWVRQPAACADDRFATMMRDPHFSREQVVEYMESLGARNLK